MGDTGSSTSEASSSSPTSSTVGEGSADGTTSVSADTSSGSDESDGTTCAEGSACVPSFGVWQGPLEIFVRNEPLPECPSGGSPLWVARADYETPQCVCNCGAPTADCDATVLIGSDNTCGNTVALEGGQCEMVKSLGADNQFHVAPVVVEISNVSCEAPEVPAPEFVASATACALEAQGTCDGGTCFPVQSDGDREICLAMEGLEAPPCPLEFPNRHVVAMNISAGTLSCDGCGCEADAASCGGSIATFADKSCADQIGAGVNADSADGCQENGANAGEVVAMRYGPDVLGACTATGAEDGATIPAVGEPDFTNPRTLCCL